MSIYRLQTCQWQEPSYCEKYGAQDLHLAQLRGTNWLRWFKNGYIWYYLVFFFLIVLPFSAFRHNQAEVKRFIHMRQPLNYLLNLFILCIGHTYLGGRSVSWNTFTVTTLRQDFKTRTLFLSWGLISWTQVRTWRSDQCAMVFEAGFQVNSVIVFAIVLLSSCVVVPGTYLICSYKC